MEGMESKLALDLVLNRWAGENGTSKKEAHLKGQDEGGRNFELGTSYHCSFIGFASCIISTIYL